MKIYKVRDWDSIFETSETKKLVHLRWVPVPTKHDGKSFRRIAALPNGCEVFTAWMLILQIASKCKPRGYLQDAGTPITAEDMHLMTGFPLLVFQEALLILSEGKIDWLETVDYYDFKQTSGEPPAITGESPVEGKEGREGIEGKGRAAGIDERFEIPKNLKTAEFLKSWDNWLLKINPKMSQSADMQLSIREQLLFLSSLGEKHAVESIKVSIRNRWKGLFEVKSMVVSKTKSKGFVP